MRLPRVVFAACAAGGLAIALSGCVVVPAGYYGPRVVARPGVYVAPPPPPPPPYYYDPYPRWRRW